MVKGVRSGAVCCVVEMAQWASDYVDITQLPLLLQQLSHSAKEVQMNQKNMGVQVAALKNEFGTSFISRSLAAASKGYAEDGRILMLN